jgi:hypothetical protein
MRALRNVARNPPASASCCRRWVLPRYLQRPGQHADVLEQDGRKAGFAVVEQGGEAVTLSEFLPRGRAARPAGMLPVPWLRTTEELARDRDYRYARVAPLDSRAGAAGGVSLGRLSSWSTTTCGASPASWPAARLGAGDGPASRSARRLAWRSGSPFCARSWTSSQIAEATLVEESLFPRRPSPHPSYTVALAGAEDAAASQPIGFLSLRPNERDDGVLSIALSLEPGYWGTPTEAQIIAGVIHDRGKGQAIPVRVMISTSAHADRSEAFLTDLGLRRAMDDRPILFKAIQTPADQATKPAA